MEEERRDDPVRGAVRKRHREGIGRDRRRPGSVAGAPGGQMAPLGVESDRVGRDAAPRQVRRQVGGDCFGARPQVEDPGAGSVGRLEVRREAPCQ